MSDATATTAVSQAGRVTDDRVATFHGSVIHVGRSSFKDSLRAPSKNNFHFQNSHLLKAHAIIDFKDGGFSVQDTHSTFGTILNDNFLMPGHWFPLSSGDVLGFIISKPSKDVFQVVDKNATELLIPLQEFSSPEIGLRFTVHFPDAKTIGLTRLLAHDAGATANGDLIESIVVSEDEKLSDWSDDSFDGSDAASDLEDTVFDSADAQTLPEKPVSTNTPSSPKSVHFDDNVCGQSCDSYEGCSESDTGLYDEEEEATSIVDWCIPVGPQTVAVEPALLGAVNFTETATTTEVVTDNDSLWGEGTEGDAQNESADDPAQDSVDEDSGPEVHKIVKLRLPVSFNPKVSFMGELLEALKTEVSDSESVILEAINKQVSPVVSDDDVLEVADPEVLSDEASTSDSDDTISEQDSVSIPSKVSRVSFANGFNDESLTSALQNFNRTVFAISPASQCQFSTSSRKRLYAEVEGHNDNDVASFFSNDPAAKKPKTSPSYRNAIKEIGKGALYVVGTIAALAVYGSTIAPQE